MSCTFCKCNLRLKFVHKMKGLDDFFVLATTSFPQHLLNKNGKTPQQAHQDMCPDIESKWIDKPMLILNHPYFYDCYQEFLPLNSILAVHLKDRDIMKSIQSMFISGDRNHSRNETDLSDTAWNNIIDNMIDILYYHIAREYKTLPKTC